MPAQNLDAYINLINALLACPQEEQLDTLLANGELIDEVLIYILEQAAQMKAEQGETHTANRLQNLAAALKEYYTFLMQVLQAVSDSKGSPEVVFPLLQENVDKLDVLFSLVLRNFARYILSEATLEQAKSIAADIGNFSNMICGFPLGDQRINLEIAINGYEIALSVYTREAFPSNWATTQNNLGAAYINRILGTISENIESAIACYSAALEIRTKTAFPFEWAMTQNNLGLAYKERILGTISENIETAIACFSAALEISNKIAFPSDWADTQNNLGAAYAERILGARAENIESAIACFSAALEIRTKTAFPFEWAMTQNNLGGAYNDRILGSKAENIESAIACFSAALEIRTKTAFPSGWATTQNNLGNAYSYRILGSRAENIETAIQCFQLALEIKTPTAFPQDCIQTGRNLGNTAFNAGLWTTAIFGYEKAIEAVEISRTWILSDSQRQEIIAQNIDIYDKAIQACINAGELNKAFDIVERSRSKHLVDLMASNDLYASGEIPAAVKEYLQQFEQIDSEIYSERQRKQSNPERELAGVSDKSRDGRASLEAYNKRVEEKNCNLGKDSPTRPSFGRINQSRRPRFNRNSPVNQRQQNRHRQFLQYQRRHPYFYLV